MTIVWTLWYAIIIKQNYVISGISHYYGLSLDDGRRVTILWDDVKFDVSRMPVIRHILRPKIYYHAFDVSGQVDWAIPWEGQGKPPFSVSLDLSEPICNDHGTVQRAQTKTDAKGHFRFFFGSCNRPDVEYTLTFVGPIRDIKVLHGKECDKKPIYVQVGLPEGNGGLGGPS